MKHLLLTCFLMASLTGMAQGQLNDYKYIIVPKKFDGFKNENQYQTSTLVKYLFSEKGFLTAYEDDLPSDLNNNRCLGLLAKLVDESSMFSTKTIVTLENCQGQEVFSTKEGKSKEKDYKDAYGEAIRDAFTSFNGFKYAYNGKTESSESLTVSFKNDVKHMDKSEETKPYSSKNTNVLIEQEATLENQRYKDHTPKPSTLVISDVAVEAPVAIANAKQSSGTLYAQELPNGYQLIDSTPKIQLKIYKSSLPDYFLAEADDKNGVVFALNGKWFFEYYSGESLITEELDIKF